MGKRVGGEDDEDDINQINSMPERDRLVYEYLSKKLYLMLLITKTAGVHPSKSQPWEV